MGILDGPFHVIPSAEVLITRSFEEQAARKLQSCHTTYTVPAASTCADGSASVRRLPRTVRGFAEATATGVSQVAPPFVEENDAIAEPLVRKGTTTFPLA